MERERGREREYIDTAFFSTISLNNPSPTTHRHIELHLK